MSPGPTRYRGPAAGLLLWGLAAILAACDPADGRAAHGEPSDAPDTVEVKRSEALTPVLVVCIDGATFDRIEPLAAEGKLPVLSSLMARGAWGRLETIEPTVSPAIWTTIATGKLPQAHGILGFEGVPGQTMTTLPTSQMRKVRAFWNILSEYGGSVGVIGWWVTWPAEPVRGYVVSDRFAYTRMEATLGDEEPKPHEVFPEELALPLRELLRRPDSITEAEVRRFMQFSDEEFERLLHGLDYRHGDFLPEFKYVYQSDQSTAEIAVRLLAERPTDVTAVGFYGIDTISHLTWHFMEPEKFPNYRVDPEGVARFGRMIDRYYIYMDETLGRLIDAAPREATVVVFSDHGFGPTGELPWSGGHGKLTRGAPLAPDGILIMAGPPIRPGVRLASPNVLDLTPTLLNLRGFPVASDMPGRVLAEALTEGFARASPPRRVATYETGPRERIGDLLLADPELDRDSIERLRALGYIQ